MTAPGGPWMAHGGEGTATGKPEYLSKADLYRAACAPRELPDNFIASLRWHLIRADHKAQKFAIALRVAVRLAEEWRDLAEASRELGHEEPEEGRSEYLQGMTAGRNHEATYCANMLLRHLAQELYRDEVPEEERVL